MSKIKHQILPEPLSCFRIGHHQGKFPIFSPDGAMINSGRWHRSGDAVIYTAQHYSTALLECLIYNGELPPNQFYIEITIPSGTSYEIFNESKAPDWHERASISAQNYGHDWYHEKRSCILIVPSVPARKDSNLIINTRHDDFSNLTHSLEQPVLWDDRLFKN